MNLNEFNEFQKKYTMSKINSTPLLLIQERQLGNEERKT